MNILIISNLYPPNYLGGYELLCAQICEQLAGKGHNVTVLTTHYCETNNEYINGVEIIRGLSEGDRVKVPELSRKDLFEWED